MLALEPLDETRRRADILDGRVDLTRCEVR